VVEPGGLEVGAELVREPLVLAEHDPRQHRAPLAAEPRGDCARHVRAEPVRGAAEPTATADDPPVTAAQDDVDATACQPATLVEAVVGTARSGDHDVQDENGALRGRPADGQLEQDPFAERTRIEVTHLSGNAKRKRRLSRRPGHDHGRAGGVPDLRHEQAAVERVEPHASPPPAGEDERDRKGRKTNL
jgi:hypothetical protein